MSMEFLSWPFIKENTIENREYQRKLAERALTENTLVTLPTGTGKTVVSLLVTAKRLDEHRGKRSLLLAPTKPLVAQHAEFYKESLDIPDNEIKTYTGETSPDDRSSLWDEPMSVVVATPQVIERDLIAGRIELSDVVHLTFDECHKGTGDYAYTYIADQYKGQAENGLVTGMSASPGSNKEEILTVCHNLGLTNIEILTESDGLLSEYTHEVEVSYRYVELPEEIDKASDDVEDAFAACLKEMKELGVLDSARRNISTGELFGARNAAQKLIADNDSKGYTAMSKYAEAMKHRRLLQALETKGLEPAKEYLDKQQREANRSNSSKAQERFVNHEATQEVLRLVDSFDEVHPKKLELRTEVINTLSEDGQVIVFTESRAMAQALTDFLNQYSIEANRFVGQGDKENDSGMSQTEQKEVLDSFRAGDIDVLVATSVAEEGLDIPSIDLVLFYEPVASALQTVQRRGRTGREQKGKVVVLIAKGTQDEAYYWSAKNKEEEMEDEMEELKELEGELKEALDAEQRESVYGTDEDDGDGQKPLSHFTGETDEEEDVDIPDVEEMDDSEEVEKPEIEDDSVSLQIICDDRELDSNVVKALSLMDDVETQLETLSVGDYVVSENCAIERKSMDDFIDTLVGGERSLFDQIKDLSTNYNDAVIILEGDLVDLYSRNVHENAIRGAIASVALDFGIKIIPSRSEEETAKWLYLLAQREQEERDREIALHSKKSSGSLTDEQEYIVSSIVDIGPVTARNLLGEFGTVQDVFTATKEELMDVEGIGETTAEQIMEVITAEYK